MGDKFIMGGGAQGEFALQRVGHARPSVGRFRGPSGAQTNFRFAWLSATPANSFVPLRVRLLVVTSIAAPWIRIV